MTLEETLYNADKTLAEQIDIAWEIFTDNRK